MAISKERKEELLGEYAELIKKSEGMILVEYRGLNMKGMDPLRTRVREAAGELHVGFGVTDNAPGSGGGTKRTVSYALHRIDACTGNSG